MRKIIFAICIVFVVVFLWRKHGEHSYADAIDTPPTVTDTFYAPSIDEAPYQDTSDADVFRYKDVKIKPLYDFIVTAKVLSKKDYSDRDAKYAPTDLALGWGKMADDTILNQLEIRQNNRWFYWRAQHVLPEEKDLVNLAANMHLIPRNQTVKNDLDNIEKGKIVQISGKLVNLRGDNGYYWNSSTTRNDSGYGACELIFVESIKIIK